MAARSWNRVELIGNLTRDPELRYTPQGTAVATFSIATNRSYLTEGERKEEVDFHRIVAWSKLAELCSQLLKKGNKVFVSGRLQNRSWEDQSTGQQRQMTEIVIEDMILLTSPGGGDASFAKDYEESVPSRSVDEMPKAAPKDDTTKSAKSAKTDKAEVEEIEDLDDLPF